jgi:hypothetical protein
LTAYGAWLERFGSDIFPPDPHHICPVCGGQVRWEASCPGYETKKGVMVCYPPSSCGNAFEYHCIEKICPWWRREPEGVRSDRATMGVRPDWMDKHGLSEAKEDDED